MQKPNPAAFLLSGKNMKKTTALFLLLGYIVFGRQPLLAAQAAEKNPVAFSRQYLNVKPPAGWIGQEASGFFRNCMAYAHEKEGILLQACPLADKHDLEQVLTNEKDEGAASLAGQSTVRQSDDGTTALFVVPLKNSSGGALIIVMLHTENENDDKYTVMVNKNGVDMPTFVPKLLQRAEPMLRAFKDLAIPVTLPVLPPIEFKKQP